MNKRGLNPDVLLAIHLSAIMSRNRYTRDPATVIAELHDIAGENYGLSLSIVMRLDERLGGRPRGALRRAA